MKSHRIICFLAVVTLTTLFAPAAAMAQRQTETVDRTLPFPSGGTLELDNFSGDIRITAGTGRNFVMKAVRRGRAERLKEVPLTVETSGSRIIVDANHRDNSRNNRRSRDDEDGNNNVVETTFEIQVPANAALKIEGFSSDITVTGIEGVMDLQTFSGNITTTGSRSAVTVETFSGRIDIDATGHGATPDLDLETFSGSMYVRLADNAKGEIDFNTFSGDLDAAFPVTLKSSGRRHIRAELPGGAGRRLTFESFSGSLRVTR
jgi:DUF4097 and DUF4098 domain-containing protein YvlB